LDEYVVRMGEIRISCRILVGRRVGTRRFEDEEEYGRVALK
jgi:hypothetical protein